MKDLTHLDQKGQARMVDVGDKAVTAREAVAEGRVRMNAETFRKALDGDSVYHDSSHRGLSPLVGRLAASSWTAGRR